MNGFRFSFRSQVQSVQMLDKCAPVFASAVWMRGQVACAEFAGVFEFLSVFEQECRAQIRTFGTIQPADGFITGFVWQFFVKFVRLFAQVFQVLSHGVVTRHVFKLWNGFVQFGIFIDMVNSLVENRLKFQEFDVVFFAGKRLNGHNQVINAVVRCRGLLFQAFGESQLLGLTHDVSFE